MFNSPVREGRLESLDRTPTHRTAYGRLQSGGMGLGVVDPETRTSTALDQGRRDVPFAQVKETRVRRLSVSPPCSGWPSWLSRCHRRIVEASQRLTRPYGDMVCADPRRRPSGSSGNGVKQSRHGALQGFDGLSRTEWR